MFLTSFSTQVECSCVMWARLLVALSVCVAAAVAADDDVEVTVKDKRPVYTPPAEPTGDVYFAESFSDPTAFQERWGVFMCPLSPHPFF